MYHTLPTLMHNASPRWVLIDSPAGFISEDNQIIMRTKLTPFSLAAFTCATLADWLQTPVPVTEQEPANALRLRQLITGNDIDLLRTLGSRPATYWKSSLRTARSLALIRAAPLKLMIGGGKPHRPESPRFSKALVKLGKDNGIVVHRFGGVSFVLAKPDQPDA